MAIRLWGFDSPLAHNLNQATDLLGVGRLSFLPTKTGPLNASSQDTGVLALKSIGAS